MQNCYACHAGHASEAIFVRVYFKYKFTQHDRLFHAEQTCDAIPPRSTITQFFSCIVSPPSRRRFCRWSGSKSRTCRTS
ncbi:unnamed protein product [Amoebophrya sp. A120]|nr:unnamed protein product [Amoebophrya sp. A120]|eukprot:GSA120T00019613001.1